MSQDKYLSYGACGSKMKIGLDVLICFPRRTYATKDGASVGSRGIVENLSRRVNDKAECQCFEAGSFGNKSDNINVMQEIIPS